jgi:hypothetical protein
MSSFHPSVYGSFSSIVSHFAGRDGFVTYSQRVLDSGAGGAKYDAIRRADAAVAAWRAAA